MSNDAQREQANQLDPDSTRREANVIPFPLTLEPRSPDHAQGDPSSDYRAFDYLRQNCYFWAAWCMLGMIWVFVVLRAEAEFKAAAFWTVGVYVILFPLLVLGGASAAHLWRTPSPQWDRGAFWITLIWIAGWIVITLISLGFMAMMMGFQDLPLVFVQTLLQVMLIGAIVAFAATKADWKASGEN